MTSATYNHKAAPLINLGRRPDNVDIALMAVGAATGLIGAGAVFAALIAEGHAAFNTSSDFAWGVPIAFYMFFLLTSSGLSIVSSLDSVFGLRVFYPLTKRAVFLSIICLVAGFSILALEIGRPFRMLWAMPFGMQVRSPMWWMSVLYSLDLLLLIAKFAMIHTGEWESRRSHVVARLSFVVCILAPGTLGLTFGVLAMRPAWYSPVMPMYFILTGFVSGISFLLFFTSLLPRGQRATLDMKYLYEEVLPRLFFISLLAVIGIRFGQIITGLWSTYDGMDAHWLQLQSPFFWIEIVPGLLVPAVLMAFDGVRRRPIVQFVAALLFNVGIFFSRVDFLIMGQKVPLFRGYWAGYVEYWPSLTEWMLIPMGAGLFVLLYGAGSWLLRLGDGPVSEKDLPALTPSGRPRGW